MKKNINFAFFGTPDVASETLEILKNNGYLPSLIITAPDKPKGRKMIVTPPPVKIWATENNIPFIQPENITPSVLSQTESTSPLAKGEA
ncbi:MAG: methionyl-tRNA formyltransferase, partial [Candidatus Paceibacterota bacterium]